MLQLITKMFHETKVLANVTFLVNKREIMGWNLFLSNVFSHCCISFCPISSKKRVKANSFICFHPCTLTSIFKWLSRHFYIVYYIVTKHLRNASQSTNSQSVPQNGLSVKYHNKHASWRRIHSFQSTVDESKRHMALA
jgi:hypothetical protein